MCKLVKYRGEQYVADIKLQHIENIVKQAANCKSISKIMLFGSALEERCTEKSDIDIAVFGDAKKNKYLRSQEFKSFQDRIFLYDLNQDYDILYFDDAEKNEDVIMRDILEGMEIYRRDRI